MVVFALALVFETRAITWSAELLFAFGWLIFVLSLGAITLLYILIRRGAAAKIVSFFYLVPPVTALLAYFLFGETLGVIEIMGIVVAALGVAMVLSD